MFVYTKVSVWLKSGKMTAPLVKESELFIKVDDLAYIDLTLIYVHMGAYLVSDITVASHYELFSIWLEVIKIVAAYNNVSSRKVLVESSSDGVSCRVAHICVSARCKSSLTVRTSCCEVLMHEHRELRSSAEEVFIGVAYTQKRASVIRGNVPCAVLIDLRMSVPYERAYGAQQDGRGHCTYKLFECAFFHSNSPLIFLHFVNINSLLNYITFNIKIQFTLMPKLMLSKSIPSCKLHKNKHLRIQVLIHKYLKRNASQYN